MKDTKFNEIKLTKKQEKQLLVMANKLFPEYGKFFEILCGDIYYSKNGTFPGFSIAWFEFTYTILLNKLVKKLGYEGYEDYIGMNSYFPTFTGIYSIYKLTL